MNNDYYNYKKSLDDLTSILSIGYYFKYSNKVIEKRIIESKYFSLFNSDFLSSDSYINYDKLLSEFYYDVDISEEVKNIYYREFEWAAMVYINIISNTNLNFETIFIYAPIDKILNMFHLYHELDINKTLTWFLDEKKKTSIIKLQMKKYGYSNLEIAKQCNISISLLDALKNRRRDIKKTDAITAYKLSKILNINIETLLQN